MVHRRLRMQQVTLPEAKIKLLDLIDAALRGELIYIELDPHHIVRLVPVAQPIASRQFGSAKGLLAMNDDFDAPLTDFDEYTA